MTLNSNTTGTQTKGRPLREPGGAHTSRCPSTRHATFNLVAGSRCRRDRRAAPILGHPGEVCFNAKFPHRLFCRFDGITIPAQLLTQAEGERRGRRVRRTGRSGGRHRPLTRAALTRHAVQFPFRLLESGTGVRQDGGRHLEAPSPFVLTGSSNRARSRRNEPTRQLQKRLDPGRCPSGQRSWIERTGRRAGRARNRQAAAIGGALAHNDVGGLLICSNCWREEAGKRSQKHDPAYQPPPDSALGAAISKAGCRSLSQVDLHPASPSTRSCRISSSGGPARSAVPRCDWTPTDDRPRPVPSEHDFQF